MEEPCGSSLRNSASDRPHPWNNTRNPHANDSQGLIAVFSSSYLAVSMSYTIFYFEEFIIFSRDVPIQEEHFRISQ